MPILTKGHTFADGDQVKSTQLNNLVDAAAFTSGAVDGSTLLLDGAGHLKVGTVQTGNIASSAITTAKLADATGSSDGVTGAKIATGAISAAKLDGAQFGTAPIYGVRAWGTFNGASASPITPTAGGNIGNITKSSTGVYVVPFTTALPDANYAVVCTDETGVGSFTYQASVTAKTTTGFTIIVKYRNNTGAIAGADAVIAFQVIR